MELNTSLKLSLGLLAFKVGIIITAVLDFKKTVYEKDLCELQYTVPISLDLGYSNIKCYFLI